MELIQGCRNKMEQEKLQRELATYGTAWLTFADCDKALDVFTEYHLRVHFLMLKRGVKKI